MELRVQVTLFVTCKVPDSVSYGDRHVSACLFKYIFMIWPPITVSFQKRKSKASSKCPCLLCHIVRCPYTLVYSYVELGLSSHFLL